MSSRWISTSFKSAPAALSSLASWLCTCACTAFTSEDLPMPRAPHRSALLAGSPRAKRSVLSTSCGAMCPSPLRRASGTRLTCWTASKLCRSACQTNASAASKSGSAGVRGASRSRAAARRSRRCNSIVSSFIRASHKRSQRVGFPASMTVPACIAPRGPKSLNLMTIS